MQRQSTSCIPSGDYQEGAATRASLTLAQLNLYARHSVYTYEGKIPYYLTSGEMTS